MGVAGFLCFLGSFVSYVNFDRRIEHMDFKRHQIASTGVTEGIITLWRPSEACILRFF